MFTKPETMKIPRSGASRLSQDVWIIGEALRRYHLTDGIRPAIETVIRSASMQLAQSDPRYAEILQEVKEEGVEDD